MSRQMGGRGSGGNGDVVRSAGSAAAKGAALIGLAVIIGVVLLQKVDTGDTTSAATNPQTTTTVAEQPDSSSTTGVATTTVPLKDARPAAQVHVLVLNGGARTGAAKTTRDALKTKGYTNIDEPNTWTDHTQTGNTVLCKPGLDRDGAALAIAVGPNTPTQPFPTPAPPFSEKVDCVIVVGA